MECVKVIDEIKAELPHYHNRTMRKAFFKICGRISPGLKPRQIYREMTGLFTNCACVWMWSNYCPNNDANCTNYTACSGSNLAEKEVHRRAIEMEDADIVKTS